MSCRADDFWAAWANWAVTVASTKLKNALPSATENCGVCSDEDFEIFMFLASHPCTFSFASERPSTQYHPLVATLQLMTQQHGPFKMLLRRSRHSRMLSSQLPLTLQHESVNVSGCMVGGGHLVDRPKVLNELSLSPATPRAG